MNHRSSTQMEAKANGFDRPKRTRHFTLIELLAAMGILVVMMLVLFRLLGSAQQAWTTSNSHAEVFENARIALDIISRDIQSAVARQNDVPGSNIQFRQEAADKLWFVSARGSGVPCELAEIGYQLNTTTNCFERAIEDSTSANWNLYGARDSADKQGGYQRVVGGVLALNFVCTGPDASVNWTTDKEHAYLPGSVTVELTLMDSKSMALWARLPVGSTTRTTIEKRAARTFSKTIFLDNRT